jgi:hypothetical protein
MKEATVANRFDRRNSFMAPLAQPAFLPPQGESGCPFLLPVLKVARLYCTKQNIPLPKAKGCCLPLF